MSDLAPPKEGLTVYQRWELPAFDAKPAEAEIALPTAEQIEQIQQQAYDEGYQAGQDAGYAAGAQRAQQEVDRLSGIVQTLNLEMQQMDQQISQDLLNLALELTKQVLRQALLVKPELLLPTIREAISTIPHFTQGAHIVLNPADAELVRQHMGEQLAHTGWKIFEDAAIEQGGCRLETAHGEIDATLETRWKRTLAAIGQDASWLQT